MCPTHHTKYDKGLCTNTELKKIGITRETYKRWVPKKKKATGEIYYNPLFGYYRR
jgi:hypothetical protein